MKQPSAETVRELPEGWHVIQRRDGAEVHHDVDVDEWCAWGGRKNKRFFGRWRTARAAMAAIDQGYPIEPPPPETKPTAAV